jgi:hypothetical protein
MNPVPLESLSPSLKSYRCLHRQLLKPEAVSRPPFAP